MRPHLVVVIESSVEQTTNHPTINNQGGPAKLRDFRTHTRSDIHARLHVGSRRAWPCKCRRIYGSDLHSISCVASSRIPFELGKSPTSRTCEHCARKRHRIYRLYELTTPTMGKVPSWAGAESIVYRFCKLCQQPRLNRQGVGGRAVSYRSCCVSNACRWLGAVLTTVQRAREKTSRQSTPQDAAEMLCEYCSTRIILFLFVI